MTMNNDYGGSVMSHTTIGAGEFKSKCLKLIDEVAQSGVELTITKRGHAVAKLVALPSAKPLFGALQGSVIYGDDIVESTGETWEAEAE
jgi:antitoxin (DNA-binding transcriptional repressor) of toxin-antitoxin stability system